MELKIKKLWDSVPKDCILTAVQERERGFSQCMNEGPCLEPIPPPFDSTFLSASESKYREWSTWRQATLEIQQMNNSNDEDFATCARLAWQNHVKEYLVLLCKHGHFKECICSLVESNPDDLHYGCQPITPLPME